MITAGIDVGLEYIKAIIMKDGKVIGKASGLSGGVSRPKAVQAVYNEALGAACINATAVERVVATGKGKFDVAFADDKLAEVITAAKTAKLVEPDATVVIDCGADEMVVATLDGDKIKEFVINQKCAAGLGLFLEGMAERFDMSISELSALSGKSTVTVNEGCIVFAELDALSLLNRGTDVKEIAKALIDACAWRASMTINDIYKPEKSRVVIMGGLVLNEAFMNALERITGIEFIIIEDPLFGGALGAATIASVQ